MNVTLYRGGVVTSAIAAGENPPDALLVVGNTIAWIGDSSDSEQMPVLAREAEVVELSGHLLTPAFHDAKLDVLTLGLQLLDLPTEAIDQLQANELEAALRTGLRAAAEAGYAVLNHHAHGRESAPELAKLHELTANPVSGFPQVFGFGGHRLTEADAGPEILDAAPSLAGFAAVALDGDFADHSAALAQRYSDQLAPQWSGDDPGVGELLLTADEVAAHLVAATRLDRPAVLRARGDRALEVLAAGFEAAAAQVGADELRRAGHQVEGADLLDATTLTSLVLFGVTIIADPEAEATHGGEEGLYARRLGPVRALSMHPWADLIATGVEIRFASHAPLREFHPWATVHAAMNHHDRGQRLNMIDAFGAHTAGTISLEVGAAATFAIWSPVETTAYPLRAQRGFGQLETVLPLPSTAALAGAEMDAGPIKCEQTFRHGVSLTSRHAEESRHAE